MTESKVAFAGVIATGPFTAALYSIPEAVISVTLGIIGVIVARTIFVNRENRRLRRKQRFTETFPLTLAALLIAVVLIHEYHLPLTSSLFVGLGVGMSIIAIMDIISIGAVEVIRRLVAGLRAAFGPGGNKIETIDVPEDQRTLLRRLDDKDGVE